MNETLYLLYINTTLAMMLMSMMMRMMEENTRAWAERW
jgi:hypothetical protein